MNTTWKVIVVVGLVAAIGGVVVMKQQDNSDGVAPAGTALPAQDNPAAPTEPLPRLVDLGADKCIPCKKMMPILEELKTTYADQFQVEFIDVWKNPTAGEQYEVKVIPTQIFYDAAGQERFRHTGFFSKEEILAKWRELGVELTEKP